MDTLIVKLYLDYLQLYFKNSEISIIIDSKIYFTADSDAILTKGLVALLLRVFTNQTPKDILAADTVFIDKIGLKEHLSPTRANGLVSMLKQIKLYAIAQQANTSIK